MKFFIFIDQSQVVKGRDERLNELEAKFREMKSRDFVTASQSIGRGETLESFKMTHLNR